MVRNVLNRLKWTGELGKAEITILHRGAPRNRKEILGKDVKEVKKSYFVYSNERETVIPLHRVLEIRMEGRIIWKRKGD